MSAEATLSNSAALVRSVIERVEKIEADIKDLSEDRKDIYTEAKSNGLDCKALRRIVALRKLSAEDRAAQEDVLETYMHALGMI